ncbi:MFS transporter [Brevibacillus dissolubilis]|uniref:MFS transporter n=1 Tax=Brevibacillus dissolubilis TaxID=1844116 RepID=UPI0011162CB0|nr:MFS transporter [Brevibacillus dissolubilis]
MSALFKLPVFRRLYLANLVHLLGNEFTFIATIGLMHDLSGSGLTFAAATVLRLVPYVLTSSFSGAVIEKLDKRKVMVIVNILRGLLVSLFFFVTDVDLLWLAFLLIVLFNIATAFFTPAMQVVIVETVPNDQRLQANSLLQGTNSLMIIIGQGIATFLVSMFSYRMNFLIDAGCYLLSVMLLLGLPALKVEQTDKVTDAFMTRLRMGFHYVASHVKLRRILVLQMAERVCGAQYTLLMFFILQEQKQPLYVFGILDIPLGLGGVLAGYAVGRYADRFLPRTQNRLLGLAVILFGVVVVTQFHTDSLVWVGVSAFLLAFFSFSTIIFTVTQLQRIADPAYIARLFSVREMLTMGMYSLSTLLVGYIAEMFGSSPVAWGLGFWGVLTGTVWLLASRQMGEEQEEDVTPSKAI